MVAVEGKKTYEFGGFLLDPLRRVLSRNGEPVYLKPKVFDTLLVLVEHAGETLDKASLMDAIWPNVVVEEHNLSKNVSVLRQVLGEAPGEHRFIVTDPGRGYRFVADVRLRGLGEAEPGAGARVGFNWTTAGVLGVLAVAALTANQFLPLFDFSSRENAAQTTAARPLPSVAVLPFASAAQDGDRAWLSKAVSEGVFEVLDAGSDLSLTPWASSVAFEETRLAGKEFAELLRADFFLRGEVASEGDHLVIDVQLSATDASEQTWDERYEGSIADIFAIQDRIAADVISWLEVNPLEPRRPVDRTRQDLYVKYLKARHILGNLAGPQFAEAHRLLEDVVAKDEDYFPAYDLLLFLYRQSPNVGLFSPAEAARRAEQLSEKMFRKWPDRPELVHELAWERFMSGDIEDAARQFERLQSSALGDDRLRFNSMVPFLLHLRRPQEAVELGELVVRATPLCGVCYANLAHAYLTNGDYDDVERIYEEASNLLLVSPQMGNNNNLRGAFAAALLFDGDASRALEQFQFLTIPNVESAVLTWSAMAYYRLGDSAAFDSTFRELQALGERVYLNVAAVYAYTGDADSAFAVLFRSLDSDDFAIRRLLPFSQASPFDLPPLEMLRSDARWSDFADRAGISEYEERLANVNFQRSLP